MEKYYINSMYFPTIIVLPSTCFEYNFALLIL